MLVDSCAMALVRTPTRFDVLVAENLFGDILTDEAAVLAGSLGMLPSSSLAGIPREDTRGRRSTLGLYEPIHGSAPDIAGQGKANPIATILSVALMLRYSLGLPQAASALEAAVESVLTQGYRTQDIAEDGARDVLSTDAHRRLGVPRTGHQLDISTSLERCEPGDCRSRNSGSHMLGRASAQGGS